MNKIKKYNIHNKMLFKWKNQLIVVNKKNNLKKNK